MTEPHDKHYNIAMQRLIDAGKMPSRMLKLRVDEKGYPVPRFVQDVNGKPDFRVVNTTWLTLAIRHKLCWLCGEPLGRFMTMVLGPMCTINRVTSEPPSHLECAQFAVQACPFMTQPNRTRDPHGLPEDKVDPGGVMIERNPGVTALWTTESYRVFKAGAGNNKGLLIEIGEPTSIEWWARGRAATREEVLHSINTGLPALVDIAKKQGPEALAELATSIKDGFALVPA
jgi:hypothetical protein